MDYGPLAELARSMVDEYGRIVTVRWLDKTPSDPAKPWRSAQDPADGRSMGLKAVAVPPTSANELGATMLNPDLVQRARYVYIVAAPGDGTDLRLIDEVLDSGGVVSRVLRVEELRPADETLVYFIWVSG